MQKNILQVIGTNTLVDILDFHDIPAKIDTGADSSSIWASEIEMQKNGILRFKFFAPSSPFYRDEFHEATDYSVSVVRSSNGAEQIRYRVKIPTRIGEQTIKVYYTLADRTANNFPILIGRRTLKNKFLVDVSKRHFNPPRNKKTKGLNQELQQDPYQFHKKYIKSKKK